MPRPKKPTNHLDKVRHLMGTMPDHEVAEECGSTAAIVGRYRRNNKIAAYDGYKFGNNQDPPAKGKKQSDKKTRKRKSKIDPFEAQVGQVPDEVIAEQASVSIEAVRMYRARRRIKLAPSARKRRAKNATASVAPTTAAPQAAAAETGPVETTAPNKVKQRRKRKSKIDPYVDMLGTVPDGEVARMAGLKIEAVRAFRYKRKIPSYRKSMADAATEAFEAPAAVEAAVEAAPSAASEPSTSTQAPVGTNAPAASAADLAEQHGYAVTVQIGSDSVEHIVIAADISKAAALAVSRAPGVVTAIRHLGPAL